MQDPNTERQPMAVVVDDDAGQRRILAALVQEAGVAVQSCSGAAQALARMDPAKPPDLIVTEASMPGIDGWRFCRLLRSAEFTAFNRVPILIVSAALTGEEWAKIAVEMGADGFLPAPLDADAFVSRVRALSSGRRETHASRVLIVEDGETMAGLLARAFAARGYLADTAATVAEAVRTFAGKAYDVAVLDYHLPDGLGDALLAPLGASRPDCVFIMITSDPAPELAMRWMRQGAATYLRKPFDPSGLVELAAKARQEKALLRLPDLLKSKMAELEAARNRENHLKQVLLAIRNVNQLIVTETDPGRLIETACANLTETLGYFSAWIALVEPETNTVVRVASAGFTDGFEPMRSRLDTEKFPACMQNALSGDDVIVVDNPAEQCLDCPLADGYAGCAGMSRSLVFDGRCYGVLAASVPAAYARDLEEQALFRELSGDLAFALHQIERQQQRIRIEASLRESEARYAQVVSMISDVVWRYEIDEQGRFVSAYISPVADRLLGLPAGTIGSSFDKYFSYVHPEDLPRVQETLLAGLAALAEDAAAEYRLRRPDGTILWVRSHGSAHHQPDGHVVAFGSSSDISERKQAEEALRHSEQRVRAKLDALLSPEGDLGNLELADIIDVKSVQAMMNDFSGLTGFSMALIDLEGNVLVASGWQEVCTRFHRRHPETLAACIESDTVLSAGAESGQFISYRCKNGLWDIATPIVIGGRHIGNLFLGQFFYENDPPDRDLFRARARKYGFDEDEYLAAIDRVPRWKRQTVATVMGFYSQWAHTISRMSYNNLKLARSLAERERLMAAIEQSGEIIVITDPRGTIQYVNPAFAQTTGYHRSEAVGHTPRILKSGEQDESFYAGLWRTITSGRTWQGRLVNRHRDGTHYTVDAVISPVYDPSGAIVNFVAVMRDVTQQLLLEQQYHQAQKMESVGRLAGGVAHDLNNLLSPILGYSDMLLEDLDDSDAHKDAIRQISNAGLRARDLVRQLLTFSRKQELDFKPLDLSHLLKRFESLLRRTIREDVSIRMTLSSSLPMIRGDVGQIEQVVMNLAVNAQDAMPEGGLLDIETVVAEDLPQPDVENRQSRSTRYVVMKMRDTGCGMDAKTLAHLFEPFFSTKGERGTGLGLATVYGIVTQHGGRVEVESRPGKGTVFAVYLPAVEKAETATVVEAAKPAASTGAETILLVEDDSQVRRLAEKMLRRKGYTVLSAGGGDEALAILAGHRGTVDLLLTDVVMPDTNGRQLYEKVAALSPKTKVLFMSGYTDDVILDRQILQNNVHFIPKPFNANDLAVKVREALEGGGRHEHHPR